MKKASSLSKCQQEVEQKVSCLGAQSETCLFSFSGIPGRPLSSLRKAPHQNLFCVSKEQTGYGLPVNRIQPYFRQAHYKQATASLQTGHNLTTKRIQPHYRQDTDASLFILFYILEEHMKGRLQRGNQGTVLVKYSVRNISEFELFH